MADPAINFGKVNVSTGYSAAATSIVLGTGEGAKLPDPAINGAYNLVWWNSKDYPDPSDDPGKEIVRVIARSGDTLTVIRAQEGTAASAKNMPGRTYQMLLTMTKKVYDDVIIGKQYRIFVTVGHENADFLAGDYPSGGEAIQAAIYYVASLGGGFVYIKRGVYTSGASINMASGVQVYGDGVNTEIRLLNDVAAGLRSADISDVSVRNLRIEGNGYASTYGLVFNNTSNFIADAVLINGMSNHLISIYGAASKAGRISRCVLTNSNDEAVSIYDNASDLVFEKNTIDSVSSGGMLLRHGVSNVRVANNSISNAGIAGLRLRHVSDLLVTGNRFCKNLRGISVTSLDSQPQDNVVITGNICAENTDYGLAISDVNASGMSITGNVFSKNGKEGVVLRGSYGVFSGNSVYDNGQEVGATYDAVALSNATYWMVIGNQIADRQATPTTKRGIQERGTSNHNTIAFNRIAGNTMVGVETIGANSVVFRNTGFKDSLFVTDYINDRVGIGKTPTARFDVDGVIAGTSLNVTDPGTTRNNLNVPARDDIHAFYPRAAILAINFERTNLVGAAGSEIILDASGANNHGNNSGATAVDTGFNNGGALSFNGINNFVQVPHHANQLLTNGFTIFAIIKPNSVGGGSQGRIVDKSSGVSTVGADGLAYLLTTSGGGNRMRLNIAGGTDRMSAAGSVIYGDGNWYVVAVTVAPDGTVTHYINGIQSGTPGASGSLSGITTTNPMRIGNAATATTRAFDGDMSTVEIYSRALTAAEIGRITTQRRKSLDSFVRQKDVRVDSSGNVLIGSDFTVAPNGSVKATAVQAAVRTISGTTNAILSTDHTIVMNATGGDVFAQLPAAASHAGRVLVFKRNSDAVNEVLVQRSGSDMIDGATEYALDDAYKAVTVQSDGTTWRVINKT